MPFHSLMFGWEFPPFHSGGLGVACEGIVRGLLHHGARVTLVLPSASSQTNGHLHVRSVSEHEPVIHYVRSSLQPYEGTEEYMLRMQASDMPHDLYGPDLGNAVEQFAAAAVDVSRDVNPDVIHCHDWMTFDAGARASKHHRKPLVAHIHATELDRTDFRPNQWIADKERIGLMKADKVIAVSNYTKNLLVSQYGIPADKIAVIHNAHDSSPAKHILTNTPKRIPLVLFLGRLTTQKNPHQFLEMAKLVRDMLPEAQFVMAGDGPMLQELIDRACDLGLADAVTFTGKVARSDVDALYKRASCFVMPSLSEPFGLVALEAASHGVPLVMSKQSGVSEVMEHCFKVDFWDTERFADCVVTILREQPLAEQLRAEAPRILDRLTWKAQSGHILSLYNRMIPTVA